jgi:ABC-type antimicrobial peptide transport system permease subunit
VIRQVMLEGTRLVVVGTLAGLAGSFLVAQWMTQITPSTEGAPPMVWIAAPLILAASIGIASIFPARKALASDPLLIMRSE